MTIPQRASPQERLRDAIRRDKVEQAARAIADGATLEHRYSGGKTALMMAVCEERTSIVECLLEHGADPDSGIPWVTNDGLFPIHFAAEIGDLKIAAMLVDAGANLTVEGPFGDALSMACKFGHRKLLELLVERGADRIQQEQLDNALGTAVSRLDVESADYLLQRGAKINAFGVDEQTDLHHACYWKQWQTVEFLLSRGANPSLETPRGVTPLDFAEGDLDKWDIDEGHEEEYEELKSKTIELVKRALGQADAPTED